MASTAGEPVDSKTLADVIQQQEIFIKEEEKEKVEEKKEKEQKVCFNVTAGLLYATKPNCSWLHGGCGIWLWSCGTHMTNTIIMSIKVNLSLSQVIFISTGYCSFNHYWSHSPSWWRKVFGRRASWPQSGSVFTERITGGRLERDQRGPWRV